MPSLEGWHDGRKILVSVAVLRSDNPADLTHIRANALLDTGATTSAISPRIISELGLEPYEKRHLRVATEDRLVNYYVFRVGLFEPSADAGSLPYVFGETRGFGMSATLSFDVILGMDVLGQCDFRLDRTGRWQLDFG